MFEALLKKMDSQKQDTDEKLQSLESVFKQLQQRATTTDTNLGNLQAQLNNRLPPQPIVNLKDNVSAITLRSGKDLKSLPKKLKFAD